MVVAPAIFILAAHFYVALVSYFALFCYINYLCSLCHLHSTIVHICLLCPATSFHLAWFAQYFYIFTAARSPPEPAPAAHSRPFRSSPGGSRRFAPRTATPSGQQLRAKPVEEEGSVDTSTKSENHKNADLFGFWKNQS